MTTRVLAAAVAVFAAALANAEVVFNYDQARTERWRCRLCPFDVATRADGSLTVGALHVDGATSRFGRDSDLDQGGFRADVHAGYGRRGESGRFVRVTGGDLGLGSRNARIRWGGERYAIDVSRRELPRNVARDGRTPYAGGRVLTLPEQWQHAYDTRSMADLATSSRTFDNATRRESTGVGIRVQLDPSWRIHADYARQTTSGTKETYADFLYQSTGLPWPVDHRTDVLGAGVRLERRTWLVAADLRNAKFRNANRALTWENPYAGFVSTGRKALAPDNEATIGTLLGRAMLGAKTAMHASLTWGSTRQDVALLPYTTATGLALAPLPAESLDGRTRTFAGGLTLVSRLSDRWQLMARHRTRQRINETRPLTLTPVLGDLFSPGSATTRTPDFALTANSVRLRYRVNRRLSIAVGGDANRARRTMAEIAENDERRAWMELAASDFAGFQVRIKLARGERAASAFQERSLNNPLTRRFHQAARDQHLWRGSLRYVVSGSGLALGLHGERRSDSYPESALGLHSDDAHSVGADISYSAGGFTLSGFHTTQRDWSVTAGSTQYPETFWSYHAADDVGTTGITAAVVDLLDSALDVDASYVDSNGIGSYATNIDDARSAFPDLVSRHRALDIRIRYRVAAGRSPWAVVGRYYRQRYVARDWALAGVGPQTIGNVLAFGRKEPDYTAVLLSIAVERSL